MSHRRSAAFLVGMVVWLAVACQTAPEPAPPPPPLPTVPVLDSVRIGVAQAAAGLPELIAFSPPGATVTYSTGGTNALLDDLRAGAFDAVLIHAVPAVHDDLWVNPVALDGIAVVAHPSNPLRDLDLNTVRAIVAGQIDDWATVGGPAGAIALHLPADSGARAVLADRLMENRPVAVTAQVHPTPAGLLAAVAADPAALGLVASGVLTPSVAVKRLTVDQLLPVPLTLASQAYPLTTVLYWVAAAEPSGPPRAVLAWLQSDEGQQAVGVRYGRVR